MSQKDSLDIHQHQCLSNSQSESSHSIPTEPSESPSRPVPFRSDPSEKTPSQKLATTSVTYRSVHVKFGCRLWAAALAAPPTIFLSVVSVWVACNLMQHKNRIEQRDGTQELYEYEYECECEFEFEVRMHNAIGVGDTNLISVRTE